MTDSVRGPNSYLDFAGLAQLRGQAHADSRAAIKRTSQQFEAMFIQMMMRAMREAHPGSGLLESNALDTYQTMHDRELSMLMAKRGVLGIGDMLATQLERSTQPGPGALQPATGSGEAAAAKDSAAGAGLDLPGRGGMPLQKPVPSLPLRKPQSPLHMPGQLPAEYALQGARGAPVQMGIDLQKGSRP